MKTKSFLSYFLAMIVASGMFSCSSSNNDGDIFPPYTPPTAPVAYTIMLYCTGGENLDMSTEADFKKICQGLQKVSNVRAFLQYKYSKQEGMNKQAQDYYNTNHENYDWLGVAGGLYRLEFKGSMIAENGGMYVFTDAMKWGTQQSNAEMYQPDSIASFIKYCQRVAPAQNYILVIGDHGSGYRVEYDYQKTRAVCSDDFFEGSPDISCSELRQGIEKSGVHLRLLNFDDCLMNNMEALSEFTDVTDYTMASSHITNGGDFTKFIEFLSVAGTSGDFIGEMSKYMDTFISEYNSMSEVKDVTDKLPGTKKYCDFVFTDMKKYKAAILPAMKAFTDKLLSEANAGTLTAATMDAAAKGCYQSTVDYPHYDIMQYATLLKNGDSNLDAEYNQLKAAIDAAQIKHVYTDVVSQYLSTAPYNKLSYNINLGATVNIGATTQTATILRQSGFDTTTGTVTCVDENGKTVVFTPGTPDTFNYNGTKHDLWAWTNSYMLTAFNKQVGWDRWIKKNTSFPSGNPPFKNANIR